MSLRSILTVLGSPIASRTLCVLAGLAVFSAMASVIDPDQSRAINPTDELPDESISRAGRANFVAPGDESVVPLGSLEGSKYIVQIHASDPRPLYSVTDLEGRLLLDRVTAEEAYEYDPDHLDLDGLLATPIGIVESADPF